jgi:membrane dipeptidase
VRSRREYEARPEGSFAIFLSAEGHGTWAGDLDALYTLAELGVTAFTFAHNAQNLLCTGANERFGEGGFSHLGKTTLLELRNLPVMVDLVHTSRASFWDALAIYDGDVFVSHSNADAVCPHPRNLTDDQIKAVAERNGVIGLNSYRGYVHPEPLRATVSDLLDHAMHMIELVGAQHVALGLDYWEGPIEMLEAALRSVDPDGEHGLAAQIYAQGPSGVEDVGRLGNLVRGLEQRGLSQADIDLVTGGSYLRMLERTRP